MGRVTRFRRARVARGRGDGAGAGGVTTGTLASGGATSSGAVIGVQRFMIWEVPMLGGDLALLRYLLCVPVPIIAGLIARLLPMPVLGPARR